MIISSKDLQSELCEMDQYISLGSFDDEDTHKELEKVSPYIGQILVAFSELEHSLELAIAGLESDRADEPGMFIIKFLEDNRLKIDYFTERARQYILYTEFIKEKNKNKTIAELREVSKRLSYAAELRNIIAHSKWNTITKRYTVVNSSKLNKDSGRVEIKLYKLSPSVLRQVVTGLHRTDIELWKLIDKLHIR